jgi:hypothetical protein
MNVHIRADLTVHQYFSSDLARLLGKNNEGVVVEGLNEESARIQWCRTHNLNPFYFTSKAVQP